MCTSQFCRGTALLYGQGTALYYLPTKWYKKPYGFTSMVSLYVSTYLCFNNLKAVLKVKLRKCTRTVPCTRLRLEYETCYFTGLK